MANTDGEGLIKVTLRQIQDIIDAQQEIMRRQHAGEAEMTLAFEDVAFERRNIPHTVRGYEMDLIAPSRVVSLIPTGSPYPRIQEETKQKVFILPEKHGGMSEIYMEQIMGVPEEVVRMLTVDRLNTLRTDMELHIRESGMLALNEAVNGGAPEFSMDFSEGNLTADFTLEKLQDMIARRRQNKRIDNIRNLILVIPTSAELQLRRDDAFDNAPRILESMIRAGALEQTLEGLSAIIVSDQMPVLYDAAGNMQDAGAPPTGVWRFPWQFYKTADKLKQLPPELRKDAVPYSDWDEDHVALTVWLIERNKAGIYMTMDQPPGWGNVETNIRDPSYDSVAVKVREFFNFGVPEDAERLGLNYVVRGENIKLELK